MSNAHSQNAVNIYGLMDVGVASLTNADNKAAYGKGAGTDWVGMANGGLSSSRLGATGSEYLSNGLSASFTLEMQLYPTTGNAGAVATKGVDSYNASIPSGTSLFNREATVGLAGPLGSVKLGRSTTITYEQAGFFDPMSLGQGLSNFGGISSFGVSNLSRADNQIKYYTSEINGICGGLAYSTMGIAGAQNAGTTREVFIKFVHQGFQLMATYQGATTFTYAEAGLIGGTSNPNSWTAQYYGLGNSTSSNNNGPTVGGLPGLQVWQFAAIYGLDEFKFNAGYDTRRDLSSTILGGSNPINVSYVGGAYQFDMQNRLALAHYVGINNTVVNNLGKQATMTTLQYVHSLSKRTDIYAIGSRVTNQSGTAISVADNANIYVPTGVGNTGATPGYGENQLGFMVGVRHLF